MRPPLILPLQHCTDRSLAGGKAVGLARIMQMGLPVPPGCCVTTGIVREAMAAIGFDADAAWRRLRDSSPAERERRLLDVRREIRTLRMPLTALHDLHDQLHTIEQTWPGGSVRWWAVRSSATDEDGSRSSHAGAYRSLLAISRDRLESAIVDVWMSGWTHSAFARVATCERPLMAVVIQPLIAARAAGVAFSSHPVTGASETVVINAVQGLADALVNGTVTPDSYLVDMPAPPATPAVIQRSLSALSCARLVNEEGIEERTFAPSRSHQASLADDEAVKLATLVKRIEAYWEQAVDIEWAHDGKTFWFLQARPMTAIEHGKTFTDATSTWSRANFKETLPELPSPLGLAFLEEFMEQGILRHYRRLGCRIPPDTTSVRIVAGRPYVNVSLFQSFTAQLWGDPHLVTEQMGGEGSPLPCGPPPLPWWKVLRAALLLEWMIRQAARRAEPWFLEMKEMARETAELLAAPCAPDAIIRRLHKINQRLRDRDLTFAIVSGVSQAFFVFERGLGKRLGVDRRALVNASLQGSGTVISANQIDRLNLLAETARKDSAASSFFLADPWLPGSYRLALAGTTFLREFDAYLKDYGHRALGESDVGSPRFSETPEYVLGVVRAQLQTAGIPTRGPRHEDMAAARRTALDEIRQRFGWRRHEWAAFRWWHRRLDRFLSLREANRHHLMYFSLAARLLELKLAEHFVASGRLRTRDDIFFLRPDEIQAAVRGAALDTSALVDQRQEARRRWQAVRPPDIIRGLAELTWSPSAGRCGEPFDDNALSLRGIPISTGVAEGPVRLVTDLRDAARVQPGDVIVTTVIDPGLAPLFSLASGLVAEMGGLLSHGAIIAREYGLPTVANVRGATHLFREGERILVQGGTGEVRRVQSKLAREDATGI